MARLLLLSAALTIAAFEAGCSVGVPKTSADAGGTGPDARADGRSDAGDVWPSGADAGTDAGMLPSPDGAIDASVDAGTDEQADGATDVAPDGGNVAAADAGSGAGSDAAADGGSELGSDAGADAWSDGGNDAAADGGGDSVSDAAIDAGAGGIDAGADAGGAVDPAKRYAIVGVGSGKCVQPARQSTALLTAAEIATCDASVAQEFQFIVSADAFMVKSVASGLCLDVKGRSTADGAAVILYTCSGAANQQFSVQSAGAQSIVLVARHSGKALDVYNLGTADGTPVIQWALNGGTNQQFQLVAATDGGVSDGGAKPLPGYALFSWDDLDVDRAPNSAVWGNQWHFARTHEPVVLGSYSLSRGHLLAVVLPKGGL